jgi:hypothetical protein
MTVQKVILIIMNFKYVLFVILIVIGVMDQVKIIVLNAIWIDFFSIQFVFQNVRLGCITLYLIIHVRIAIPIVRNVIVMINIYVLIVMKIDFFLIKHVWKCALLNRIYGETLTIEFVRNKICAEYQVLILILEYVAIMLMMKIVLLI